MEFVKHRAALCTKVHQPPKNIN